MSKATFQGLHRTICHQTNHNKLLHQQIRTIIPKDLKFGVWLIFFI